MSPPDTLVTGATGFMGRWLVAELLSAGRPVAVTVRGGPARAADLRAWLRAHDVSDQRLTAVAADVTRPGLALAPEDETRLESVRDVFNTAGVYRFGLGRDEARPVNVDGAVNVLRWAAARPRLRRLVHISGCRVGAAEPPSEHDLAGLYRRLGAYEASKREGDAAVRRAAAEQGIPLTVVNPATVIGHSATGESGQYLGLAGLVERLWSGRLPALPGSRHTYVPVVTADHLARFLAAVPEHDRGPFRAHWVLDDATPELPELVALLARHLGLRAPRVLLPAGLVRRLPRALTGAEPESLTFISEDRYDTSSADALAGAAGLAHPPVREALRRWAGRLVADLPGLGRSAPSAAGPAAWLAALLAPVRTRPVLVAHSAGAAPALRHAHAHPGRLAGLVLVSPHFLQRRPPWHLRAAVLAGPLLRTVSGPRLARALLGPGTTAGPALESAVAQLRRPGVARRTARRLDRAQRQAERAELRALTATCPVPVRVVAGEHDPLVGDALDVPVTIVHGAGHHPELSHPAQVAAAANAGVRPG
ncbi:alpha/beta fold hydrolase [Nonomuraea deserti]|uniref:Alpha/beta fold hydrolase n=1 Tax=Nonomuraea deserti TaxID=1848322 RepID=A0A4R4UK38_9ACTN|nr:alpha/beta fold hydrolase [Nonomuraea deserti]TDC88763.1 alpha/beta fold hydrolase [Nonomuraea deserti]